jgi:hypothetical protein
MQSKLANVALWLMELGGSRFTEHMLSHVREPVAGGWGAMLLT